MSRPNAPREDDFGAPRVRARRKPTKKKPAASGSLQRFLRPWLIACVVVLTVAVLFAVGGLFSETLAIIASMICVVAIVGCLLAGTVWMAIDLGKENVLLGLGVLLVPVAGPAVSFAKKGPALRGAAVFMSMLAPLLLLGLMLLVFWPMYPGRQAAQTANWEELMHPMDSQVGAPDADCDRHAARRVPSGQPGPAKPLEELCPGIIAGRCRRPDDHVQVSRRRAIREAHCVLPEFLDRRIHSAGTSGSRRHLGAEQLRARCCLPASRGACAHGLHRGRRLAIDIRRHEAGGSLVQSPPAIRRV